MKTMSEASLALTTETVVGFLRSGQALEAEHAARKMLEGTPQDCSVMLLLAISLSMMHRHSEAADLHRRLIELQPDESTHYNNLASSLLDLGSLDEAEASYRKGLALKPDDAGALAALGELRWQRGDAVETRELMISAWRLDPGMPEPRIYGAPACHECADTEMAERLLEGSEGWQFLGPKLEADLAAILMQIERTEEAEKRLRALLTRPDAQSIARVRLASLFERVNRLDEAEAILDSAVVDPADKNEEKIVRATLAARRGRFDVAIPLYRDLLDSAGGGVAKAETWFALAKACDATNDTDGAMEALRTAHALQMAHAARLVPNLMREDSNPLDITSYPVAEEDYARWIIDPNAPSAESSPIFIVGFPRSGTTLLEQMLDAHPGLRSMDERAFLQKVIQKMQESGEHTYPEDLHRLDASDLEELRKTYWQNVGSVVQLKPGERLVDKNPLNIMRLPIIHRIFPNARIILALRHPCDVLLSNYMQCFRAPAFQVLCSSFQRLARGYDDAMEFWVRHAKLFNTAAIELRYEDLLDDFEVQARRIADHLGLTDVDALQRFQETARAKGFISTPSYAQVVEPLNKKAVGRWHRYSAQLEPVLPVLMPAIERWNYTEQ
jgi:Flp pilus assembly protein TadD